ncbi:MAG: type I deoxyribonuclease HsdR [Cyclobacteriaceae bacterium]|nr:MAG: type I deoxyribonuclease HsdR [Cyclobacteriaceae bacterium]
MKAIITYLNKPISIAPLAMFRVLFGFIMLISIVRFALNGWIKTLYIDPQFYFPFFGFEWVQPLGPLGMYLMFAVMAIAAMMIMIGFRYRAAVWLFFLCFTYVELIDKTNYLNHYYFVSIVSMLLIFLPANRSFSVDSRLSPGLKVDKVPRWTIFIIQLQLAIVYFYAGAAKLNAQWLVDAMPLKIWLPAHAHLPVIGQFLKLELTAYFFSWAGAFYDLTIVFFLLNRRTRLAAYSVVVVFHLTTALLFQIGMFPYIMILATLIFFSPEFHEKLISKINSWINLVAENSGGTEALPERQLNYKKGMSWFLGILLVLHFSLQLLIPLRSKLYTGEVFWTEQGYRFSWRVMLMEKAGMVVLHVTDPETNKSWEVPNYQYLTANQEKMMATQPDMILQFAHYLEKQYQTAGYSDLKITAESYVTLNGKRSRLFIDPQTDLTQVKDGWGAKSWILPMNQPKQISVRHD